jgi:putative hydrolase of the HAD superfamily
LRQRARPVWFFDLDNTLHDASWRIFGALDQSINAFIAKRLGLDDESANRMRADYWQRFGATMAGLSRYHGIDVMDYLEETHRFIETGRFSDWVRAENSLARSLAELPGKKILLTNAPSRYAEQVVGGLGISHLFDELVGIDHMQRHGSMRPKPSRFLLATLTAAQKIEPRDAILVEDSLPNLKSARAVGWRTVHVARFATNRAACRISRPSYVDLQVKSIAQLARRHRLLASDAKR